MILPRGSKFMIIEYYKPFKEHEIVDFAKTEYDARMKIHALRKKRYKEFQDDLPRREKLYPELARAGKLNNFEYKFSYREIGSAKKL